MASLTQWTRVWVNSRSCSLTGRPGVLQSMGSQRVGHNWVTELNWLLLWLISHAYPSLHLGPDQVLAVAPLTLLCSSQLEWSLSLVRTMHSCSVKELAWTWHYVWTWQGQPLLMLLEQSGALIVCWDCPSKCSGPDWTPTLPLLLQHCHLWASDAIAESEESTHLKWNKLESSPQGFGSSILGPSPTSYRVLLTTEHSRNPSSCVALALAPLSLSLPPQKIIGVSAPRKKTQLILSSDSALPPKPEVTHRADDCCCCLVMSGSLWSHGLKPSRLFCSWDSLGKNIGDRLPCPSPGR